MDIWEPILMHNQRLLLEKEPGKLIIKGMTLTLNLITGGFYFLR